MADWTVKKKYPGFWVSYTEPFRFRTTKKNTIENTRFVAFDTETTGLNVARDRILSIGAVSIIGNSIDVSSSLEIYLNQQEFNAETVKIHGILKNGTMAKMNEEAALIAFVDYIRDAVLVAHHVDFDVAVINKALERLNIPNLKNKRIDTGALYKKTLPAYTRRHFGLDELCETFKITKHDRHTALGDAYLTGLLFLKVISVLKKNNSKLSIKDLFIRRGRLRELFYSEEGEGWL